MGEVTKSKISLNKVIDVLSTQVPNVKEIISLEFENEVNEYGYETNQKTLIFSVNTLRLKEYKDFNKILNTIRYCGLTNITRIGYSDKSSILLNIIIDVTNLNVYYEYH